MIHREFRTWCGFWTSSLLLTGMRSRDWRPTFSKHCFARSLARGPAATVSSPPLPKRPTLLTRYARWSSNSRYCNWTRSLQEWLSAGQINEECNGVCQSSMTWMCTRGAGISVRIPSCYSLTSNVFFLFENLLRVNYEAEKINPCRKTSSIVLNHQGLLSSPKLSGVTKHLCRSLEFRSNPFLHWKPCSLTKLCFSELQEASPWTTFGHVAGNGAIMEAFEGEMKVHIVDISGTYCTQWPTLLEALATRAEGTPHLRLTTIVISPEESALKVMKQIMTRLERFARLMGVPFEFAVTQQPQLEKLELAVLDLRQDEALAVNCIQTLHHISESVPVGEQYSPRDLILCTFRNANPKVEVIEPSITTRGGCQHLELNVLYGPSHCKGR